MGSGQSAGYDKLIFDGKGYRTPLQSDSRIALDFLRRDIAALSRAPQYRPRRTQPSSPRPKPLTSTEGSRSLVLVAVGWAIGLTCGTALLLWGLYWLHCTVTPALPALPTGIVPFGPMSLVSFSVYAFGGLFAGIGLMYWWLRSSQN